MALGFKVWTGFQGFSRYTVSYKRKCGMPQTLLPESCPEELDFQTSRLRHRTAAAVRKFTGLGSGVVVIGFRIWDFDRCRK